MLTPRRKSMLRNSSGLIDSIINRAFFKELLLCVTNSNRVGIIDQELRASVICICVSVVRLKMLLKRNAAAPSSSSKV